MVDLDRTALDALLVLARASRTNPSLLRALRRVADRTVRPRPDGTDALSLDGADRRAALALIAHHLAVIGADADARAAWTPVADALAAPR